MESALLGALQGLTEFLPVSSSGHLVLAENLLSLKASDYLFFDILLHVATVLAVCVYFKQRLVILLHNGWQWGIKRSSDPAVTRDGQLIIAILLSTIVTGVIGFPLEEFIESIRDELLWVGLAFLFTGILLLSTRFVSKDQASASNFPNRLWVFAILMGIAQAVAIVPGVSRSGATICTALLLGMHASFAVEYSFLMSIPIILGVSLIQAFKMEMIVGLAPSLAGFGTSLISGLMFLWLLVWITQKGKLYQFAFYTIPLGLLVLWFSF